MCLIMVFISQPHFFCLRKFAQKSCLDLAQSQPELAQLINERIHFNDSLEGDDREYSKREVRSLLSESVATTDSASTNFDLQVGAKLG